MKFEKTRDIIRRAVKAGDVVDTNLIKRLISSYKSLLKPTLGDLYLEQYTIADKIDTISDFTAELLLNPDVGIDQDMRELLASTIPINQDFPEDHPLALLMSLAHIRFGDYREWTKSRADRVLNALFAGHTEKHIQARKLATQEVLKQLFKFPADEANSYQKPCEIKIFERIVKGLSDHDTAINELKAKQSAFIRKIPARYIKEYFSLDLGFRCIEMGLAQMGRHLVENTVLTNDPGLLLRREAFLGRPPQLSELPETLSENNTLAIYDYIEISQHVDISQFMGSALSLYTWINSVENRINSGRYTDKTLGVIASNTTPYLLINLALKVSKNQNAKRFFDNEILKMFHVAGREASEYVAMYKHIKSCGLMTLPITFKEANENDIAWSLYGDERNMNSDGIRNYIEVFGVDKVAKAFETLCREFDDAGVENFIDKIPDELIKNSQLLRKIRLNSELSL